MSSIARRGWEQCIVAATGPSLTQDVADTARMRQLFEGWKIIAVNDAIKLMPFADVLYACDKRWWEYHQGAVERFTGERWTSTSTNASVDDHKESWPMTQTLDLRLVRARPDEGFCFEPGVIHYGNNSGFQAVNLALQFGARVVKLVGFNMQKVGAATHFFGEHPPELNIGSNYQAFVADFDRAAKLLPADVAVINCTPGSALRCFPQGEL